MKSKLVLGDGLMGSEIIKLTGWDYISRKKDGIDFVDINSYVSILSEYDEIVNCIAYCNTYDSDRENHWNVNYKGVVDLVDYISQTDKKLIHYSTDYIYSNSKRFVSEKDVPVHCENWYGYTKLIGDSYVQLKLNDYLIIRGTHKSTPFQYQRAFINQIGNFDYVDEIAKINIDLINGNAQGIYNVGTDLKTMYDLAKKTKVDVIAVNEKFHETMPNDITMDLGKLDDFFE